jgi:hypothetical protein
MSGDMRNLEALPLSLQARLAQAVAEVSSLTTDMSQFELRDFAEFLAIRDTIFMSLVKSTADTMAEVSDLMGVVDPGGLSRLHTILTLAHGVAEAMGDPDQPPDKVLQFVQEYLLDLVADADVVHPDTIALMEKMYGPWV